MDKSTEKPIQTEMPFAIVQGEQLTELPKDLYIPPVALQVFLEAFEGPPEPWGPHSRFKNATNNESKKNGMARNNMYTSG